MSFLHAAYLVTGGFVAILLAQFAIACIREKQPRATIVSVAGLTGFAAGWMAWYLLFLQQPVLLAAPVAAAILFVILFFAPIGRMRGLVVGAIDEKVDERDTVFAREEYEPGSERYDSYYARRPELTEKDDRWRKLPRLMAAGGRFYDEDRSAAVQNTFEEIGSLVNDVDGAVGETGAEVDPAATTAEIKRLVRELGAEDVGIARLNPMFVYSHVGRGPEPWGQPIENNHQFAVVFTLEMDYDKVATAPALPITEEAANRYLQAAQMSIELAGRIRKMGFPARAHISDSNYQIMLPPVACDAGLGELGRLGYLISPRFGARVRLGGVTTDLPMIPDKPITFGVQDFCNKCLKCATNCPSGAIPKGDTTNVRGVEKWPLNVEQCLHYWRMMGTDCGLCMKVCPFSHPPTFVHNVVKVGIKRSAFARTVSAWGDDLVYGRKVDYPRS